MRGVCLRTVASWRRAAYRRRAGVARGLAAAGLLAVGPGPVPAQAQESDTTHTNVEVHVASAGGQPLAQAIIRVTPLPFLGRETAWQVRIPDGAGMAVLQLRATAPHRLVVSARGHQRKTLDIPAGRGPHRLRVILSVDPYVLPPIVASGTIGGGLPPARSVRQVQFDGESLTYATVAEWLGDVAGAGVRRQGAGGRQVVSIRGSRPEAVLVLLDGMPLNDPLTGRADLSTLPVSSLESATLVSGSASTRLGSGAGAGALLLTSRRVTGTQGAASVRAEAPGGLSFDARIGLGSADRRMGLNLAGSRFGNEFEYVNRLLPGSPVETRRNADVSAVNGGLTAGIGAAHGVLRVERIERGVPGRMGTSLFDEARAEDRSWTASAGLETVSGRASAGLRRQTLEYRDGGNGVDSRQAVGEIRLAGELLPRRDLPITLGGRMSWETVRGDGIEGRPARGAVGGYVSAVLSKGWLRIDPAVALDLAASKATVSPELGVSLSISRASRVWGRIGQGFRLPTFADLYFASQYLVRPNADLAPERVVLDSEIGGTGTVRLGAVILEGEGSGWLRRTDDPIVWLASSVAVWSPRNLGELESRGVELSLGVSARYAGESGWRAQVAGSFEDSRVRFGSNKNPLPYHPGATGRLTLEGWLRDVSGRVDIRHTGSRTTSIAATRRLPAFTTVDFTLSRVVRSRFIGVTALARVENLLDHRYELMELFPEPGRRFVVRIEARRPD